MATGPNLLTGDSANFEGGTVGIWAGYLIGMTNTTAIAHTGTHSGMGTAVGSGPGIIFTNPNPPSFPSQPNTTFTFTAWFSPGSTARTLLPQLIFYDSGANQLFQVNGSNVTEGVVGSWVQVAVTGTSPPNTAIMRASINLTVVTNEIHYMDDAFFAISGSTPTYPQWSSNSLAGPGLQPQTVRERSLAALATIATGTNPDGTNKGS